MLSVRQLLLWKKQHADQDKWNKHFLLTNYKKAESQLATAQPLNNVSTATLQKSVTLQYLTKIN